MPASRAIVGKQQNNKIANESKKETTLAKTEKQNIIYVYIIMKTRKDNQ